VSRRGAEEICFETKPAIALSRFASGGRGIPTAGTGRCGYEHTQFREGVTALRLLYISAELFHTSGSRGRPLPKKAWSGRAQPPNGCGCKASADFAPGAGARLPERAWKSITWRPDQGSTPFAVSGCPGASAHRMRSVRAPPEKWLLIEWPRESRTHQYWRDLAGKRKSRPGPLKLAGHRTHYEELKQDWDWGIRGRGWPVIISCHLMHRGVWSWWPRGAFSPRRTGQLDYPAQIPEHFRHACCPSARGHNPGQSQPCA